MAYTYTIDKQTTHSLSPGPLSAHEVLQAALSIRTMHPQRRVVDVVLEVRVGEHSMNDFEGVAKVDRMFVAHPGRSIIFWARPIVRDGEALPFHAAEWSVVDRAVHIRLGVKWWGRFVACKVGGPYPQ